MRAINAELLSGDQLYRTVILDKLAHARESVWISTANVKAMFVESPNPQGTLRRAPGGASDRAQHGGRFRSVLEVFAELSRRGVELRLLHAELPSRPFRATFDRLRRLVQGGLELKICPRVHFKAVIVDGAWVYLGSANLTGAGLGAKHADQRNFELGFVTEDFETIDRATALFHAVWSGAECRTCRLREICPDPIGEPAPRKFPRGRRKTSGIELGKSRRLGR